jgi:cold-inducible RNA-binding protein
MRQESPPRMKKVFVGNLSFSATESTVRSVFEAYGSVESVNIVTDRDSGQPRGFGFVEMTNDAQATNAINGLNGKDLEGRKLNVNEAHPKTERPGGGGGYGRKR